MSHAENTSEESVAAWLALTNVRGVGPKTLLRLHQANSQLGRSMLDVVRGAPVHAKEKSVVEAEKHFDAALDDLRRLREKQIQVVTLEDSRYPKSLIDVRAPPILFLIGDMSLLERRSVAIVGSRRAPERALRVAHSVAAEVSRRNLNVISGYASGVDTESHLGALEAGGSTTVVLPYGIEQFDWKVRFREYLPHGRYLVLSTFPPRLKWSVNAAMERNRYICALAGPVLVVAAARDGGTMNTAHVASELRRPVYVIDFGDDDSEDSFSGNRELLAKGARPVRRRRDDGLPNIDVLVSDSLGQQPEAERQVPLSFGA